MSGPTAESLPSYSAQWLAGRLADTLGTPAPPLCVAWSGGADSTALLVALAELRDSPASPYYRALSLRAVHIDHHLQAASLQFRRHCRRLSRHLRVRLSIRDAHIARVPGASLEALARDARYALLAADLAPGEWLLTGQHAEDQLETILLQLLRGAGVAGLAGMSQDAALGRGRLWRPLLAQSSTALRAYLTARGVPWIEDPSNADLRFDRNYLRAHVLPALMARWPAAARTASRSARHAAESDALVQGLAARDFASAADGEGIDLAVLRRLSAARQRAALRHWLERLRAPLPDASRLTELQRLLWVREDAQPLVHWQHVAVRRYDDRLHLCPWPAAQGAPDPLQWAWRRRQSVALPGGGSLRVRRDPWGDIDLDALPAVLTLRFRAGGESLRSGGQRREVKSLLREARVLPWRRDAVPLICTGSLRILAVGDLVADDTICARDGTRDRGRFIWQQQ